MPAGRILVNTIALLAGLGWHVGVHVLYALAGQGVLVVVMGMG